MTAMIAADLLKLRRKRGLWYTTLALGGVLAVIIGALGAIVSSMNIQGGTKFAHDVSGALVIIISIVAAVVGARLGSDEHTLQTFRYQVLSGRSRAELFAAKIGTLVAVMTLAVLIATVAVAVMSFVPPPDGASTIGPRELGVAFWQMWLPAIVYGCLSLGVGSLIRATGGAIALSIVLQLIGVQLVAALTLIADFFKYAVLSTALDRITTDSFDKGDDLRVTVVSGIITTAVWVALFLGLGLQRTRRSED